MPSQSCILLIALAVLAVLAAVPCQGATYFIATTGDDTSGDGSIGNPWKTFAKLNATLAAGDIGYARAGTYVATGNRMINPANSGSAGNTIRYSAYAGETVILDGNSKTYYYGFTCQTGQDYIEVVGLTFQHWKYGIIYLPNSSYIGVTNCSLIDCQDYPIDMHQAGVSSSDHVTVDGCSITSQSGNIAAVHMGGGASNTVQNCTIITTDTDGIISPGSQNTIKGNLIYCADTTGANHDDGIEAVGTTDLVIENNLIHSFTQGIYMPANRGSGFATTNTHIRGNVLYNKYYWSITTGEAPGIFYDDGTDTDIVGLYIYNNTFMWCGLPAVRVYCSAAGSECDDLVIVNNVFVDAGIDVAVDDPLQVTSDYNIAWESGFQPDTPQQEAPLLASEGVHSLDNTDPDLTSYDAETWWDYHLLATSPAIGSGAGLVVLAGYFIVPSPWTDREGNTFDGTVMGADQPPAFPECYLLGLR